MDNTRKEKSYTKRGEVLSVKNMALIAMMTAITCIMGPFSIKVGAIPYSLTPLAIFFTAYLLGAIRSTISCCLYLLMGFIGLPVFSGFSGGAQVLAGPTGGYLIGFIFMAFISGLFVNLFEKNVVLQGFGMIVGLSVTYLFGTIWFMNFMKTSLISALAQCVIPFLIGDFIKIVLAVAGGKIIKNAVKKANLL